MNKAELQKEYSLLFKQNRQLREHVKQTEAALSKRKDTIKHLKSRIAELKDDLIDSENSNNLLKICLEKEETRNKNLQSRLEEMERLVLYLNNEVYGHNINRPLSSDLEELLESITQKGDTNESK